MSLTNDINGLPTSLVENTTNHLHHHEVIHSALKNNNTRLVSVEAMNGVTPEAPVDGQTASLITQPDTLTNGAVVSLVKDNIPVFGSEVLSGANGVLNARLMTKDSEPILLVFAGSSTTSGTNVSLANRWVSKIAEKSSHDPVISSYEDAVAEREVGPFHKDITVINMGRSGFNASTYIRSTEAPVIGSWSPTLVMHAAGANDARTSWGYPDTVGTAIGARIDAIDAASPLPVAHIVMHQHERYDGELLAPWEDYLEALLVMASTRPNVRVINAADVFKALRIPGGDPLGLMASDKIHVNTKGHGLYSELIGSVLNLPEKTPKTTIFLDDFNRPDNDDIGGDRPTTGPSVSVWESSTTNSKLRIQDNRLVADFGTSVTSLIDIDAVDYDITVDFDFLNPGVSIGGVVFRAKDINNRWGVYLGGTNNNVQIYRMVNGVNSTIYTDGPIPKHSKPGLAKLRIRVYGPRMTVWIDDDKVIDYSMSDDDNNISRNWTKIGLRVTGQVLAFDNLKVVTA